MTALPSSTLAAFDLDLTLTRRDCVLPFMVRVAGWPRVILAGARHLPLLAWVATGRGNRDRAKAALVSSVFRGRSAKGVADVGESFALATIETGLRPDTVARLRWHQQQGHTTALVSASLAPYVHPIGRLLGIDYTLCTELTTDASGLFTGALDGGNCRGPEKEARLRAAFPERPLDVWAYGDSNGDREMLAWSDHPTLLTRDLALRVEPLTA